MRRLFFLIDMFNERMTQRLLSKAILLLLLLNITVCTSSQNTVLVPEIINFTKNAYDAGTQNRVMAQGSNGLMYFANNDGLLVYDGTYWKLYALPNRSMVRAVLVDGDRIYVGGQQEIGYFYFDGKGSMAYRTLKDLIPPGENDFTDVWHVVKYENDIFFRSSKRIFRYTNNKIFAFKSIDWRFLGTSRGVLLAQQYENGLMMFAGGQWRPYKTDYDFSRNRMIIRSVSDFGTDKTMIATVRTGIYLMDANSFSKFDHPSVAKMSGDLIHTSAPIDTARTIIGTKLGGYYIIDSKGNILQQITKKEGLQTNTINNAFVDREQNIWLGLENGIDLVVNNSAINHLNPNYENRSPGYSAMVFDNRLFVGTNVGLYSMPLAPTTGSGMMKGDFSLVKNSNGIVWGLSIVNDQLLMGKNDGCFRVINNECIPIDTTTGFWSFHPVGDKQPASRMIGSTYSGINLYDYSNGRFSSMFKQTLFESAKYTVTIGDEIWAVHPYLGLYKISLPDTGGIINTPYKDVDDLLSDGHNHLFKVRNKMTLLTKKGVYEYDSKTKKFTISSFFNQFFPAEYVSYLREDASGNVWFIQDKKPGVIDMSKPDKPAVVYFPELNNQVLGNDEEFIYPINKNNILISGYIGLYHIDYERYANSRKQLRVLLRGVTASFQKDSVLFGGYQMDLDTQSTSQSYTLARELSYKWNSVHFDFSAPFYGGTVEYSYRLAGYEDEFSPWSKRTERSYTNLPPGDYVFEVKAKNSWVAESALNQFSFTVLPPWYRTVAAYLIYFLLIVAAIYWFYKRQQRKYLAQAAAKQKAQQLEFKESQQRLKDKHQHELEMNEKEIIRLKNIKLEAEIQHNHAELASNTMSLLQKKELLNRIKDEIIKVQAEGDHDKKEKNVRRIIKVINDQLEMDDDWERFTVYFDRVNNDFLKILKEKFPSLTPADLKLCAYLRLSLSTKEIADLLNLSVRGVESSRYRLRKKLELPNEVSLLEYLEKVGGNDPDNNTQ
jgi:DNA-binding CsgD family transcriptional regulator